MNTHMNNQAILASRVKSMVLCQGLPICVKCAMESYKEVSRQNRPLVQQWVVYEEVRCSADTECVWCGN